MHDDDRTIIARRSSRVAPGTRLNGIYQIDSLLDFGGMSEIYRGHNIQTLDEVAIKVILPEFASDERMVSLFRREALILNRLSHEAIVRYHVFSHDPAADLLYLAMEYVNGPTLRSRIRQRPLSQMEACRLIAKVAAGMRAAHGEGVVHRDLSTDNIILVNGDVNRPKVIDFGIARAGEGNDSTLLQSGFAGKYNFVSPEQLGLFDGQIGQTSDIYSLGLVFAAALLGKPLDMAGSHAEVVMKRQSVPDLSLVNPGVKPLIERMLQPNPVHRPQSMDDVVMALDLVIGQRREATHPGTGPRPVLPRVPATVVPPRRRGAGLFAVLVALSALAGASWWGLTRTEDGRALLARFWPAPATRPPQAPAAETAAALQPGQKSEIKAAPDGTIENAVETPQPRQQPLPENPPEAQAPAVTQTPPPPATPKVSIAESQPADANSDTQPVQSADAEPVARHAGQDAGSGVPQIALAAPERPVAEPSPAETPAIGPAQWVARFQGGDCYFARTTRAAAGDVAIEGFGTSAAPFEDMDRRFTKAFGFEPAIGVRAITQGQCPVIDLVRGSAEDADAMRIAMESDLITAGESVSARISGITQRHVALFVVYPDGTVSNVTSQARRDGDGIALTLAPGTLAGGELGGYMLWTVASSKPLAALDLEGSPGADGFVVQLKAAAEADGATLQQTIRYFRRK
jgi:serine/threonine-protein kinase